MLVALPMLWTTLVPQHALAAEFANTDETKTNLEIQVENIIAKGIVLGNQDYLGRVPYNFPGYEPVKTADELKREKVLARYKDKLAKTIFPKGQFTINASAYTAAADECGKSDGITASGLKVKENHTIACPPQFPLGTKMKIEGYGTFVCEDRGGAIKGNHIDIYVQTKKQAFAFGRRNLTAEIVL
ncbi:MAG: 3D domain-containing protein [Candidatus Moranbacteria bacterium]|nr:3D domain-containing protein [Candidatus Moranbacteria bacterium]